MSAICGDTEVEWAIGFEPINGDILMISSCVLMTVFKIVWSQVSSILKKSNSSVSAGMPKA